MSTGAKPFRVLGIQQIAIGGLDKSALTKFWVNTLGIEKVGEYKAEVTCSHSALEVVKIFLKQTKFTERKR